MSDLYAVYKKVDGKWTYYLGPFTKKEAQDKAKTLRKMDWLEYQARKF